MPNHARIAVWTAICAALAVTPGVAGPSAGMSGLSNGMAGVRRSMGNGDYAGASSALGGLFDAGGGGFSAGASPVAAKDNSSGNSGDLLSAELREAGKSAWAGAVPAPKVSEDDGNNSETGVLRSLARLSSEIVKTVIIVEQQLETATEKAAKAVEDEGTKRAREGAEKQREAEKKWEGKERNYPQYENKK